MSERDRQALVQVLIENPDPSVRARAHAELGRRAAARDDVDKALLHYREAAELDPTDDVPRQALQTLGRDREVDPRVRRSVLRRLFRGLSRR